MTVSEFVTFLCMEGGALAPYALAFVLISRFVSWLVNCMAGKFRRL